MKKEKTLSPYRKFDALTEAEKEKVYRSLDDPQIALRAKPLSPSMRKLWNRARKKAGRPRVGQGAKRVLLSIEGGLLKEADALARRKQMSRSELFSQGVRAMLKKAG